LRLKYIVVPRSLPASITVDVGSLCWMWIEEAYELMNMADFDIIDESIRGEVDAGLFKQITLTFNPWNEHHWIKKRFFDAKDDVDILALTTNYLCNEWLDKADLKVFESMLKNNPRRYQVAGLGDWGIVDGLVFENWKEQEFTLEHARSINKIQTAFGLDFGYTNDPSALFCSFIDVANKKLYVWDEMYECGMSNEAIYNKIVLMGYAKEKIITESAEPKSIARLRTLGLSRIRKAEKGKGSIKYGIDYVQEFQVIIHPRCVNFLTEISNYTWDVDRFGQKINKPIDDFNHLMDAMRYALESFSKGATFEFE